MKRKPTISANWEKPSLRRCDRKRPYLIMRETEIAAEKVTVKGGRLPIAYTCPDCGSFHIGHADQSQQRARLPHVDLPCQNCGGVIPPHKKEKASRWGNRALYCFRHLPAAGI